MQQAFEEGQEGAPKQGEVSSVMEGGVEETVHGVWLSDWNLWVTVSIWLHIRCCVYVRWVVVFMRLLSLKLTAKCLVHSKHNGHFWLPFPTSICQCWDWDACEKLSSFLPFLKFKQSIYRSQYFASRFVCGRINKLLWTEYLHASKIHTLELCPSPMWWH